MSPTAPTREALARETGEAVRVAGRDDLVLTVAEVTPQRTAGAWSSFSVVLSGPASPVLPQGCYGLELGGLGEVELFLVPIERDEAGAQYEAVFNRAAGADHPREGDR